MTMQLLVRVVSVLLLVKMTMALVQNVTDPDALEQERLMLVQDLYEEPQAENVRLNDHFFCINRTLVQNADGDLEPSFTDFEQTSANVWTLFFQLPALAYLDPERKKALLQIVLNVLNTPDQGLPPQTANPPENLNDLCIGTFEFYELTTFRESVLFHLYSRDTLLPFTAMSIADQFHANVLSASAENNIFVVEYPEQPDVIAFNLSAMMLLQQNETLLQSRMSADNADPAALAVYLGSFGSNLTIADLQNMNMINDDMFAENPNPVNYGLEAGDIVFAVLGSILLVLLTALIFLGYCIHPFWLA